MNAKRNLIVVACVAVVSIVLYGFWLLRSVDAETVKAKLAKLTDWLDLIPAPTTSTSTPTTSTFSLNVPLWLIVGLFGATVFNLFRLKGK